MEFLKKGNHGNDQAPVFLYHLNTLTSICAVDKGLVRNVRNNNNIFNQKKTVTKNNQENHQQSQNSNNNLHDDVKNIPQIIINKSPILRRRRSKSVGEGFKFYASYSYYAYKGEDSHSSAGQKVEYFKEKIKHFFDIYAQPKNRKVEHLKQPHDQHQTNYSTLDNHLSSSDYEDSEDDEIKLSIAKQLGRRRSKSDTNLNRTTFSPDTFMFKEKRGRRTTTGQSQSERTITDKLQGENTLNEESQGERTMNFCLTQRFIGWKV